MNHNIQYFIIPVLIGHLATITMFGLGWISNFVALGLIVAAIVVGTAWFVYKTFIAPTPVAPDFEDTDEELDLSWEETPMSYMLIVSIKGIETPFKQMMDDKTHMDMMNLTSEIFTFGFQSYNRGVSTCYRGTDVDKIEFYPWVE